MSAPQRTDESITIAERNYIFERSGSKINIIVPQNVAESFGNWCLMKGYNTTPQDIDGIDRVGYLFAKQVRVGLELELQKEIKQILIIF